MLDHVSRRSRSLLSLSLTSLALALSVLAFCTSYWCEGMHKVIKPLCLSPVKMDSCGSNDSQLLNAESSTPDPKSEASSASNGTEAPETKAELMKTETRQLTNAVQYIWETGEDKYMFRYFHTGFWESCENHMDGEKCRSFKELTPGESQGVLWLSVVSEIMHICLLAMGFILMWLEVLCSWLHKDIHALKVNAFAAICTVLSGLMGMVAHMMYTTVFQLTVTVGPKDWRPQTWDYGWSFALAWVSFSCCMAAAVLTLNSYTKTIMEQRHRLRLRLQDDRFSHVPSYSDVLPQDQGVYCMSDLLHCQNNMWGEHNIGVNAGGGPNLVLLGVCGAEGCEDCEREMNEMEEAMASHRESTLC